MEKRALDDSYIQYPSVFTYSHNTFLFLPPKVFSPCIQSVAGAEQIFQSEPGRIDGARPCVYEQIIQETPEDTATEGSDHRNLSEALANYILEV
jgi:hypothetical protein